MGPNPLGRGFAGLTAGLSGLGTAWILVLMAAINADIVGRAVFGAPIAGVAELVSLSITGIVFAQLGHALRAGRFVRSDALAGPLARRPRLSRALEGGFAMVGAVLFGVLAISSLPALVAAWEEGVFVGAVGVVTLPVWPVNLVIVLGSSVVAVQYLLQAADAWRGRAAGASA